LSSFHVFFFEASHWPSGNIRPLIGQPSFTTKLRGEGGVIIIIFFAQKPLGGGGGDGDGEMEGGEEDRGGRVFFFFFCIKAPLRRQEGIKKMLKSFLAAVLLIL
jgi:hypothetical protein